MTQVKKHLCASVTYHTVLLPTILSQLHSSYSAIYQFRESVTMTSQSSYILHYVHQEVLSSCYFSILFFKVALI